MCCQFNLVNRSGVLLGKLQKILHQLEESLLFTFLTLVIEGTVPHALRSKDEMIVTNRTKVQLLSLLLCFQWPNKYFSSWSGKVFFDDLKCIWKRSSRASRYAIQHLGNTDRCQEKPTHLLSILGFRLTINLTINKSRDEICVFHGTWKWAVTICYCYW